jgi:hypothetical protein
MGYFSNGTEGMMYEEMYCQHCIHNEGCPVWGLHFEYNYTKNEEMRSILDYLIPRLKDGGNAQCSMYCVGKAEDVPARVPLKGTVARLKNSVVAKAMEGA